ncbi:MAG: RDD family protein [Cytophagales bacterium]|nr:RDD family protein [Armatimonadota bacterium]
MICPQCGTLNQNTDDSCHRCKRPLHPASMKGKIACSTHANREATTSGASCGTRLCEACAVNWNGIDYCDACAPAEAVRTEFDEDYEKVPALDPATAERAGFGSRLSAVFVDAVLIALTSGVLALLFWLFTGSLAFLISPRIAPSAYYLYRVLFLIGVPVYVAVTTAISGQTVGKQVSGVIVLEPDGHILNVQQSVIRTLAAIVSALPFGLGFLWAIWDKDQETWHDKLAKTAVFKWGGGI